MNLITAFILGVLVGWLIEWLIDYFYWRKRYVKKEILYVPQTPPQTSAPALGDVELEPRPVTQAAPDDLQIIKGIGPVIERKLNEAGITTFEQMGNLTPADLRRILGNTIERLADEEVLLQQARTLTRRK
jgi:predicted flap endonuclease-1-like 5' DNA nuclease